MRLCNDSSSIEGHSQVIFTCYVGRKWSSKMWLWRSIVDTYVLHYNYDNFTTSRWNHERSVVFNLQFFLWANLYKSPNFFNPFLYRYIPTYYLQLLLYCSMLYGLAIFAMITTTICNYVNPTNYVHMHEDYI